MTALVIRMPHLTTHYNNRFSALCFTDIRVKYSTPREDIEHMMAVKLNSCCYPVFYEYIPRANSDKKANPSTEFAILNKAAKILRRDYLHMNQALKGSLSTSCAAESTPPTMKSFLHI